ncbi:MULTISPECIES: hypothetical protein [unclassified Luteimonas]
MKTLNRIIRLLMLIGGTCGAVACLWALVDPSIITGSGGLVASHAPSPRWRAAFGLVFSIGLVLFGSGALRHRKLP